MIVFLLLGTPVRVGTQICFLGHKCVRVGETHVFVERERERERARERERHMLAWGPHMCAEANVCGHTNVYGDTFL